MEKVNGPRITTKTINTGSSRAFTACFQTFGRTARYTWIIGLNLSCVRQMKKIFYGHHVLGVCAGGRLVARRFLNGQALYN